MEKRGLHLIKAGKRHMQKFLCSIAFGASVACAVWFCSNLSGNGVNFCYADQTLLAGMEQTKDSVSYGAGSVDSASDGSSREQKTGQSGIGNTKDYIQYQAGPSQAQVEVPRRQEEAKEAASLNMLQNLFIDLDARPRAGPLENGGMR